MFTCDNEACKKKVDEVPNIHPGIPREWEADFIKNGFPNLLSHPAPLKLCYDCMDRATMLTLRLAGLRIE